MNRVFKRNPDHSDLKLVNRPFPTSIGLGISFLEAGSSASKDTEAAQGQCSMGVLLGRGRLNRTNTVS